MRVMPSRFAALALLAAAAGACAPDPDEPELGEGSAASFGIGNPARRWTGGEIYYVIDKNGDYPKPDCDTATVANEAFTYPDDVEDTVRLGAQRYEDYTPLRFHPFDPGDEPPDGTSFLIFTRSQSGTASSGTGGMPADGKSACMYLGDGASQRSVEHELGHALGTPHEQQRPDRDDYVVVDTTCTRDDAFDKLDPASVKLLGPYDLASIMQYGSDQGCDCNKTYGIGPPGLPCCPDGTPASCAVATVRRKMFCPPGDPLCGWIEKSPDLSPGDINTIFRMYERAVGTDDAGDHLGTSMATGDFDGDGYLDLAVGAPANVPNSVMLYRGTGGASVGAPGRLVAWKPLYEPSLSTSVNFGYALAAGDFDGDGIDDLAVGAPASDAYGTGKVHIYRVRHYDDDPSQPAAGIELVQSIDEASLGGSNELGARFGLALAAGDFNGDTVDDLAIGAPRKLVGSVHAGQVSVLAGGATLTAWLTLTQANVSGASNAEGDRFGAALVAGDFDLDAEAHADLIVGAPETETSPAGSGAVYVFLGGGTPPSATLTALPELRPTGSPATSAGNRFGYALAAGDFDGALSGGKRVLALAVGAPMRGSSAGRILVYRGNPGGSSFALSFAQELQQSGGGASGDHLGSVLLAESRTSNPDILCAGVPDRDAGGKVDSGAILEFAGILGASPPLAATPVVTDDPGQHANDRFGSSIALGAFYVDTYAAGAQLVGGAPGYLTGAGAFFMRRANTPTITWQPWLQSSANPQ